MATSIQAIPLSRLTAHPDNPNRMSSANFRKLVRNIKGSGRYEPLIVRPHSERKDCYEVINGHNRARALTELGCEQADCLVWQVDDEQTDILLVTLNRLSGSDLLSKKLTLLERLTKKISAGELAKSIPQTAKQIERLVNLNRPAAPVNPGTKPLATAMVFFVSDIQLEIIEKALSLAPEPKEGATKAGRRAAALTIIAQRFLTKQHNSACRLNTG